MESGAGIGTFTGYGMKILVTNDDGILSPVLATLADALSREHHVLVVAPSTDQSGMSQAFTHGQKKRLSYRCDAVYPYPLFQVVGTPCDCIKFAISELFKDEKLDLVISGINLGENAGMSAIYSGTVAAAREAAMWGIPAIAISVWTHSDPHVDAAIAWLLRLLRRPGQLPKPGSLWNVNFPACDPSQIQGVEITAMSTVMFKDSYETTVSSHGLKEFRLQGYKPPEAFLPGTDDFALHSNKISITPLQVDQTNPVEASRLAALSANWN